MNLDYIALLERISEEQSLGLRYDELPLIITTENMTYTMCFITYEDSEYLCIVVPDHNGVEYAKILNKSSVLSVEIVYAQMFEESRSFKEDGMYV